MLKGTNSGTVPLNSIFGGNRGQNQPVPNSQSTQNLSTAVNGGQDQSQERANIPRVSSTPGNIGRQEPELQGQPQGGPQLQHAPMPTPAFMEHLAGIQRRGGRLSNVGWQQHPVEANSIFLGPRPPTMLPIYTFDQYLCCYSRHYRAFTSNLVRRHDVPLLEQEGSTESIDQAGADQHSNPDERPATPQPSSSRRQEESTQVRVNNNGELVFTENPDFENFIRSALRSVLNNMADVNPSISSHGNPFVGGRVCAFNPIFATPTGFSFSGTPMGPTGDLVNDNAVFMGHMAARGSNAGIPIQRVVSMGMEEQSPPHDHDHDHDHHHHHHHHHHHVHNHEHDIRTATIEGTIEFETGDFYEDAENTGSQNSRNASESNDQQQPAPGGELMNMFGTVMNSLASGNNAPLSQLFPDERGEIVPGMGFVALIAAVMFRSLGLLDMMRLLSNDVNVISNNRNRILGNVIDFVLDGNSRPSNEDLDSIADRLTLNREAIERFVDNQTVHGVRDGIDIVQSLMAIDRQHIRNALGTVLNRSETDEIFANVLYFQATSFFDRIVSLAHIATGGRDDGFETIFTRVMDAYSEERAPEMRMLMEQGRQTMRNTIRERFPNGVTIIDDLRPFLVRVQEQPQAPPPTSQPSRSVPSTSTASSATTSTSVASSFSQTRTREINEEEIRRNFPEEWAKIIIEDMKRQNSYPPRHFGPAHHFSDAYNLGTPFHRRAYNIPRHATNDQILSDALHTTLSTAMETAGIPNPDSVLNDVEMTDVVESAFRSEMDNMIEQRLKREADYEPEKFPNIKKRFNPNPDQE